jgi:prepilin-type N-terminal cleavage/methylation domain-containing protein
MKTKTNMGEGGFTLIEILAVIAIVAILAAIMIPVAGGARATALRRRAAFEMQSIKTATIQFHEDHRYMPWPGDPKVGEDRWTTGAANQQPVMELLTGENALNRTYLQIPEKSRPASGAMVFNDPWGQPYQVGMDRNMDGAVQVSGTGTWDGSTVMEKVLVFTPGPPGEGKPLKTFDVAN